MLVEDAMTSSNHVHGGSQVWEQLLIEARDLRRKQDAQLISNQQRSAFLFVGFLAITAIVGTAIAAPAAGTTGTQLGAASAGTLVFALANGLIWYLVHQLPQLWHEAPDVGLLVRNFSNRFDGHRALQRHLERAQIGG